MKKPIFPLVALAFSFSLVGCSSGGVYAFCSVGNVSTDVKSYRKDHDYKKVLVDENNGLGTLICNQFNKNKVDCFTYDQIFSPLDDFTHAQIAQKLKDDGFDSVITIRGKGNQVNTYNGGSFSTLNASTLGNTTSGTVVTTNISSQSRDYALEYLTFDVSTEKKIYSASTYTSGSGSACIGNDSYWRSQAEYVVKDILLTK